MLLTFEGRDYDLNPGESVLDGMARHGVRLPSSCRVGTCQACLLRAVRGDPGRDAVAGLKPTWQAAGYFLACQARPSADLSVAGAGPEMMTPARLAEVRSLSADVLAVTFRSERPIDFLPGQHVALTTQDGLTRVYSCANLPGEAHRDGLQIHVRAYPGGAMSQWLRHARPGTVLTLGAPAGECCYLPGDRSAPLLLAGTGTGIAPLMAIARAALADGHHGPITLIHGAAEPSRLYAGLRLPEPIQRAARAGRSGPSGEAAVTWRTCVRARGEDIATVATAALADLTDRPQKARAYLCGGQGSVIRSRRELFLAGMSSASIYADRFIPAAPGA